jgi:heme-degrading monooxygenase HmoA
MHARVIAFQARSGKADEVARILGDAAPEIRDLRGFREGVLLLDRQSGKGMTITLWEDEQAVNATADAARGILGRAAELFDDRPAPQSYTVAEHRPGSGKRFARVSIGTQTAEAAQQSGRAAGENPIIAAASQQPGYAGFLILADPASRRLMGMSFWDSEEHLRASESGYYTQQMNQSREQWQGGQWTREVYEVTAAI